MSAGATSSRALNGLLAGSVWAGCIALAVFSYQALYAGFHWDDGFYLLMADRYSPYAPDRSALLSAIVGQRNYPPLYPLVLAWAGGGSAHIGAAKLATAGLLALAMLAYARWLNAIWQVVPRPPLRGAPSSMLGVPWGLHGAAAALVLLGFMASPAVLLHFQTLWSEHAYLAFSLCALAAASHARSRGSSLLLAAFFITLAALSRSAGLALILAFNVYALRQPSPRRALALALANLPFVLERGVNAWLSVSGHSYQGHWWSRLAWPELGGLLQQQAAALWQAWLQSLSLSPGTSGNELLAVALLGLVLAGLIRRLREGALEAVYVPGYLVLISLWPFPEHSFRFLYPLVPVLFGLGGVGLMCGLRSLKPRPLLLGYGLLVLGLVGAPTLATVAPRLARPLPAELEDFRQTGIVLNEPDADAAMAVAASRLQFIKDMRLLVGTVPPAGCVLTELPILVQLYAKRLAVLPAWTTLREASHAGAVCPYYYLIPIMLPPQDSPAEVDAFASRHRVLQMSNSPRDPTGREKLGVLLELKPDGWP